MSAGIRPSILAIKCRALAFQYRKGVLPGGEKRMRFMPAALTWVGRQVHLGLDLPECCGGFRQSRTIALTATQHHYR